MSGVIHALIARRAFEIYEQRGGEHGHDWADWLQAEREVLATLDADSEGMASHAPPPPDHAEIKGQKIGLVRERPATKGDTPWVRKKYP